MILDATPLIHLSRIGRLDLLEGFSLITTDSVKRETLVEGKIGVSRLKEFFKGIEIVELSEDEMKTAMEIAENEKVHQTDAELLVLGEKKNCILLTNDKALVTLARIRGVRVWWVTTLILNLVKDGTLGKDEGKDVLSDLIMSDICLSTNVYIEMLREIDRM